MPVGYIMHTSALRPMPQASGHRPAAHRQQHALPISDSHLVLPSATVAARLASTHASTVGTAADSWPDLALPCLLPAKEAPWPCRPSPFRAAHVPTLLAGPSTSTHRRSGSPTSALARPSTPSMLRLPTVASTTTIAPSPVLIGSNGSIKP